MKILKLISLFFLVLILGALISANLLHRTIRKKMDPYFQPIENENLKSFDTQSNEHYFFQVQSDQKSYEPYRAVLIYAVFLNKDSQKIPDDAKIEVSFFKGNQAVKDIRAKNKISLHYQKERKLWVGQWFPQDHRITGSIRIQAKAFLNSPEAPLISENHFFIRSEENTNSIKKGLAFVCIDSKERIARRTILSTEGKEVNWNEIPNWIRFIDADGVFMLGGITKTFEENASLDNPWEKDKINESIALSERLKKENKKFGVWIKALELEGTYLKKMGYQPTLNLSREMIVPSKNFVSLLDANRKKHLTKLLSHFAEHRSIQYVGLSKLFPPNDSGIEMLEAFIKETQIAVPENWNQLSTKEKIKDFDSKLQSPEFYQSFSRWKNYKIADYIREILPKKSSTRFFYSTDYKELMEHPDLIPLIFESGIDFFVLNLNAPADQLFEEIQKLSQKTEIEKYFPRMLISYEIDYKKIHRENYQISAIQNYSLIYDNLSKISRLYPNIQGIVIRDFYRAMFGKRGPYSPYEWMLGIAKTIHQYKNETLFYPISVQAYSPLYFQNNETMKTTFRIMNQSTNKIYHLKIRLLPLMGKNPLETAVVDQEIDAGKEVEIPLTVKIELPQSKFVRKRQFLGYHISWSDHPKKNSKKYEFTDYQSFILQSKSTEETNENETGTNK